MIKTFSKKLYFIFVLLLFLITFQPVQANEKDKIVELPVKQFNLMIQTIKELQEEVNSLKTRVNNVEKLDTVSKALLQQKKQQPYDTIGEQLIFGDEEIQPNLYSSKIETVSLENQQRDRTPFFSRFQNMNPDISVLGDINGIMSTRSFDPDRSRINLREVELGFQSNIDPYSRADFFLGIHRHNHNNIWDRLHHHDHDHNDDHAHDNEDEHGFSLDVEEAYITLLALPGGFQTKMGKFYNAFGVLNRVHQPELPQFDRPNVLTNFFGNESLSETGVNISRLLPLPWYSRLEFEITDGQNDLLFGANKITRPLMISHLTNYWDITDNTSLRLGISGAFGSREKEEGQGRYTGMQGADLTFFWMPRGRNQSFKWQTEVLATQLEGPSDHKNNFWGMYSFAEYQLSQRWSAGFRFDYSQVPQAPDVQEYAFSPYINFWQSDFARLRFQYKHTFRNYNLSSDQFFIQYTFMLGTHKPHDI